MLRHHTHQQCPLHCAFERRCLAHLGQKKRKERKWYAAARRRHAWESGLLTDPHTSVGTFGTFRTFAAVGWTASLVLSLQRLAFRSRCCRHRNVILFGATCSPCALRTVRLQRILVFYATWLSKKASKPVDLVGSHTATGLSGPVAPTALKSCCCWLSFLSIVISVLLAWSLAFTSPQGCIMSNVL